MNLWNEIFKEQSGGHVNAQILRMLITGGTYIILPSPLDGIIWFRHNWETKKKKGRKGAFLVLFTASQSVTEWNYLGCLFTISDSSPLPSESLIQYSGVRLRNLHL